MSHRTIIDGYNLLHAAGLVRGKLIGKQLEGARLRLLQRLAHQLPKEERAHTVVVFDAKAMLPVSCREELMEGIRVLYPEPGHEADELIEQLIAQDLQPRKLIVVSSDRRLHRAARERMATAINSDRFLDRLDERRAPPTNDATSPAKSRRPAVPLPPTVPRSNASAQTPTEDVDYWLKEFGTIEIPDDTSLNSALEQSLSGREPSTTPQPHESTPPRTVPPQSATTTPSGRDKRPSGSRQPLIVPLPARPDLARLPPRPKGPTMHFATKPEPDDEPASEKPPVDADLERWKDALQQVLDEENKH